MKLGLLAASLVLVLGAAVGCSDDSGGSGGSAQAPSVKAFCGALKGFEDDFSAADPTKDLKGYIQTIKKAAAHLDEVGTPKEMPAKAKAGFDFYIKKIKDLSDDATVDDLANIGDVSDADQENLDALDSYVSSSCPGLGDEASSSASG